MRDNERGKADMDKARIYVDFNEMVDDNTVLLSKEDTKVDSEENTITFYEGMPVSIYTDDEDENGEKDNLIAEGVAIQLDLSDYPGWQHVKWCCRIDEKGIMHESELDIDSRNIMKNLDDRIAQIMKKMELLSTKNPEFACGKFPPEWKAQLTEAQVSAYEAEKGIKLPEDYRRFITTVASAGTQPFYGLYGLLEKKPSYEFEPIVEKKFPYTINSGLKVFEMEEDEYERFWNDQDNDECIQGFLLLCTEGCGMDSILVVNTDDEETYGTVWFYDLSNDFGIMPIYHPQTQKPMHFLDWLEYFVDKTLELPDDDYFSYGELTYLEGKE